MCSDTLLWTPFYAGRLIGLVGPVALQATVAVHFEDKGTTEDKGDRFI